MKGVVDILAFKMLYDTNICHKQEYLSNMQLKFSQNQLLSLSIKIFDRFIRSLDFNRNIFSAEDIKGFSAYRVNFDDAIERGNLSIAYKI